MIAKEIAQKIKAGATVRVWEKVKEGDKERLSRFEGIVLARKHGSEPGASFMVRATVVAVGVEKTYPLHSPMIEKVDIISSPKKVHRAKAYYVRNMTKKAIRQKLAVGAGDQSKMASAPTASVGEAAKEEKAAA